MRLILASSSPRRREILKIIGLKNFEIIPPTGKELKVNSPKDVKANAILKARSVERGLSCKGEYLIIASDTAVFVEKKFLGKPKDREEAKQMLATLSGKWHTVYTAIGIIYRKFKKRVLKTHLDFARVKFKELSDKEIEWYLSTEEPYDKAGAYGIQGFGAIFIEKIVGDYFTVMGISPSKLYKLLVNVLGKEKTLNLFSP
ncbi:MAG TPA: septum formation protein Maf [Aquifex aeolicus]|uniref:dTTP/UTP pyrophosphatase n=1 Tax=Aquifex aeolicus TaxID=63363 RepID=A0A9D0YND9_AQUAO|nr:septum formation protein Maf [Aquificales bacterium]HIP97752.1 septum formation protein Maf [Aquifex aeolicus]HIQ25753.1 septum formation protein Maf [Aquifex aeolicus]